MINGDREPLYVFYGEISVLHLSDKLYLLALHTIQAPGIGFRIFYTSIKDGDFEDENQNRSLLHLVWIRTWIKKRFLVVVGKSQYIVSTIAPTVWIT